jgi:hypothetical protein
LCLAFAQQYTPVMTSHSDANLTPELLLQGYVSDDAKEKLAAGLHPSHVDRPEVEQNLL